MSATAVFYFVADSMDVIRNSLSSLLQVYTEACIRAAKGNLGGRECNLILHS